MIWGNGHEVAQVRYWSGSENVDEVDANAHLIAAAPELLEAAKKAMGALAPSEHEQFAISDSDPWAMLRAAVNKAIK